MDIQQAAQWITFEYAVFAGALVALFVVAWKLGIASLSSFALAFLLTPFVSSKIGESVAAPFFAALPHLGSFIFILTILYLLLRRVLGEDFSYPSYFHLTLAASAALIALSVVWVNTPELSALFSLPAPMVTVFSARYAIGWMLLSLLILGFTRRGYFL